MVNKPIIKMKCSSFLEYTTDLDYDIKFLGDRFTSGMVNNFIEGLETILTNIKGERFNLNYGNLVDEDLYYNTTERDLKYLAELNDCKFGTVGYSPWSFYVAYKDVSVEFIRDFYEGWSFYDVVLLDCEGFTVDSIGGCYIKNTDELKQCVSDNFGVNDFYLVDNNESTYFDLPKISEVKHIRYSYEIKRI